MDREPITIPEVFRKAMEEYGWDEGGDDDFGNGGRGNSGGGGGPQLPSIGCSWQLLPLLLLVFLFLSSDWMINVYTEWLWFGELGYDAVWLKQWGVQVFSFALFFVVALLVLMLNWHLARIGTRPAVPNLIYPSNPLLARGLGWLISGAALVMAYLFASAGASQWETFLRYYYSVPFGTYDPVFDLDISFYLFDLPIYSFLRGWFMGLIFITLVGVIVIYATSDWRKVQNAPQLLLNFHPLRRQVALLGGIFFVLWALGDWLATYNLLFSSRGTVFGAGYTDLNASLLALRLQMVLMLVVAFAVAFNAFRLNLRLPLFAGGVWFAANLLVASIYPALLQNYVVEPNELAREEPYIQHNIEFTRLAFGLDKVETRPFTVAEEMTQQDLNDNEAALQNVRVWDQRPLLQTYSQLQELRPYYQFVDVDIDRYQIDGLTRQVMLSARELNKDQLTGRSWVNQKLEFTHGYGLVMNPVDRFTRQGQPEFFISDLPPKSNIELEVTRPEIYYGELQPENGDEVVFVSSGLEEFDYPSGNENFYTHYEGKGGVPLGGTLRRLLFAIGFGEFNLLFSEYITPDTRVMFHREIRERVQRITPFLALDSDPYLVVADGRLVWMMDAYTHSRNFPYSTPVPNDSFNYIRNAAKITVDAYHGTVTYYLAAPDDPIAQTYSRAFPDLFKSLEEMPPALLSHIRYPEDLFKIQTEQYLTYHMTDLQVFYNKEDLWEIPNELFNDSQVKVEPYYVIFSLPGENTTEFLLIRPYVPRGKDNMIAWIAARNDVPNYGQLVAYELPKQQLVFGPSQIESRIDQDPIISSQLSLWNQQGSGVIRGNLIVIPIGNSFLYVEPLYLQSESSALPELKRVIVASPTRIIMRETLSEALAALVDDDLPDNAVVTEQETGDTTGTEGSANNTGSETTPAPPDATVEQLIISANGHFQAAEEAQRTGDWATYGRELQALEEELNRLMELSGTETP
ncbi:MAG: UPF0182 family protein [Ardenticatenaceae bacterium]